MKENPLRRSGLLSLKDGKFFVVQVIKTCIFPLNYVRAIVENESPYRNGVSKKEVPGGKR